jgi:hypothetical protein
LWRGEVFGQHREVVPEVEVSFGRAGLGQCAATYVVYSAATYIVNAISLALKPPTEINLFHMGEKTRIEAAYFVETIRSDTKRCAAGPKYWHGIVILPFVGFEGIENAPTAKGIPPAVYPSAAGSGILKVGGCVCGFDFGLTSGYCRVAFEMRYQWVEPVWSSSHIGVEQNIVLVLSFELAQGFVVSLGKAPIVGQGNQPYFGVLGIEPCNGVVGGGVVGYNHMCQHRRCVGQYCGQKAC